MSPFYAEALVSKKLDYAVLVDDIKSADRIQKIQFSVEARRTHSEFNNNIEETKDIEGFKFRFAYNTQNIYLALND
jgi:hypothetical protein